MTARSVTVRRATPSLGALRAAQRQSLAVFRAMVDALARPARIVHLPSPPSALPPVVQMVLALADPQTGAAVVGAAGSTNGDGDIAALVHRVTNAPAVDVASADIVMVLAPEALTAELVASVRIGSATAPEAGARLLVAVNGIGGTAGPGSISLTATGPGASAGRTVSISGLTASALAMIDRRNAAYPAGLDTWLVDSDRRCIALPRSSTLAIVPAHEQGGVRWATQPRAAG